MARNEYVRTVENTGWYFYELRDPDTMPAGKDDEFWDALESHEPAEHVLDGGAYLLLPQPGRRERMADAFAKVHGLGPCLRITYAISPEYKRLSLRSAAGFVAFSKLAMEASGVRLYSNPLPNGTLLDEAVLPLRTAEVTFAAGFDIMTSSERRHVRDVRAELGSMPPTEG